MTEIEPNQIVILASVPVISHSLFRTGSERINLTQNIKIEIDKNLVRDKPLEFVTKTVNIRTDFVKKCLKNQFSLDPVIEILPVVNFSNGRRIPFPITLSFKVEKLNSTSKMIVGIHNFHLVAINFLGLFSEAGFSLV